MSRRNALYLFEEIAPSVSCDLLNIVTCGRQDLSEM